MLEAFDRLSKEKMERHNLEREMKTREEELRLRAAAEITAKEKKLTDEVYSEYKRKLRGAELNNGHKISVSKVSESIIHGIKNADPQFVCISVNQIPAILVHYHDEEYLVQNYDGNWKRLISREIVDARVLDWLTDLQIDENLQKLTLRETASKSMVNQVATFVPNTTYLASSSLRFCS